MLENDVNLFVCVCLLIHVHRARFLVVNTLWKGSIFRVFVVVISAGGICTLFFCRPYQKHHYRLYNVHSYYIAY